VCRIAPRRTRRCRPGTGDDVAGNPDDEQVAQALIEDDLGRHARVGAAENDRERLLSRRHLAAAGLAREGATARHAGLEPAVTLPQAIECFPRRDHRRFMGLFTRLVLLASSRRLLGLPQGGIQDGPQMDDPAKEKEPENGRQDELDDGDEQTPLKQLPQSGNEEAT